MIVTVKARFNSSKQRTDYYGNNKYIIYIPFEEDSDSGRIIAELLSRHLGTPASRIILQEKN